MISSFVNLFVFSICIVSSVSDEPDESLKFLEYILDKLHSENGTKSEVLEDELIETYDDDKIHFNATTETPYRPDKSENMKLKGIGSDFVYDYEDYDKKNRGSHKSNDYHLDNLEEEDWNGVGWNEVLLPDVLKRL